MELPTDEDHPLVTACTDRLRRHARGRSLADLRLTRDASWRGDDGDLTPVRSLTRFAERWLCWDQDGLALAGSVGEPAHERAAGLRWVCLALPVDLLAAAVAANSAGGGCHGPTLGRAARPARLGDPLLVAETHLHIAASFDYGQVWAGLMLAAYAGKLDLRGLPADRATPFGGETELRAYLLEAALLRIVLTRFVAGKTSETFLSVRDALGTLADRHDNTALVDVERAWTKPGVRTRAEREAARTRLLLRRVVARLRVRDSGAASGRRSKIGKLPGTTFELAECDPIGALASCAQGSHSSWERWLQVQLLRHLSQAAAPYGLFERIAMQYLRAFAWLYRFVIQEPGVGGLDWFRRHYARVEALTAPLEAISYQDAAGSLRGRNYGQVAATELVAVEARTTPKSTWVALRRKVDRARTKPGAGAGVEMALVLHFIRHSIPEGQRRLSTGWYATWYSKRRREANAVAELIRMRPEVLSTLRGVDAANDELSVPTWAQLPLYARVLSAVEQAAPILSANDHRFGMTAHVGEDFRTLHEGLRRIDEMLAYYESEGLADRAIGLRLGHALALGLSPSLWAGRRGEVLQPKIERIWDLVWELELSRNASVVMSPRRRRHHIERAAELSGEIGLTERLGLRGATTAAVAEQLVRFRSKLHDASWLSSTGYPVVARAHSAEAEAVADLSILERGSRPVRVRLDEEEVRALERMQESVRDRALGAGVTIEANPSSNLLVGDLGTLREHPVLAMAPVGKHLRPSLPVSLNSDDPLTFATTLGEEFAYMRAALESSGFNAADVARWLEARAADGRASRFTVELSGGTDVPSPAGNRDR
ncbi:MAG: hypothetical protein EVA89_06915 [Sandaracinaceae bacterium]|nr:MAG: hypothetical protein EVA89_06915 [Sandaracinaceae bacterium]